METKVARLLELFTLEEAILLMDITPEEVLEILLTGGHVELPPFLQDDDEGSLEPDSE